jgi:hypothetical protein
MVNNENQILHMVAVILLMFGAFVVNCDSRVTNMTSYPSPNKQYVLVTVVELQGANDPAPWWTHISIRKPNDNLHKIPGNIIKLVGRGATAKWVNDSSLTLYLSKEIMQSSYNKIPTTKKYHGIVIEFIEDQQIRK